MAGAPRPRAGRRLVLRAAWIAALLTGSAPLVARPAWAATTAPADSISVVADPGTRLVAPADGRLRGDHLAATITGVAWPGSPGSI